MDKSPSNSSAILGRSIPRSALKRLLAGRGKYTDDLSFPRMLEVAFVRSPFAHASIKSIKYDEALQIAGVEHVFTGKDIAQCCTPWIGTAAHRPNFKSAPQYPMAVDKAVWQGEPVVAIVAATRALAEDAIDSIYIDWEELTPVVDPELALEPDATLIHPELGTNLADDQVIKSGDAENAIGGADKIVECTFHFGRQTGVTLEPRTIIADFDPSMESLTVYQSHQSPFQMQDVFSRHLGLSEDRVRVICPDVGGAFGVKLHVYGDEVATVAISKLIGRPVKFCADRLESFVTDTHARDHRVTARMGVSQDGRIEGLEIDDLVAVGPFSHYRRFSNIEGLQVIGSTAAPYKFSNYEARMRTVYQNKNMVGMYRGVGLPIACAVGEQMIDLAAAEIGMDPVEYRLKHYITDDMYPHTTASGVFFERLSLHRCLKQLTEMMRYDSLRKEQQELRGKNVCRGIGISTFIEQTAYGSPYYGPTESRVSVQEGCTVKLEPAGKVRCLTSATDQGQGTVSGIAQIVASEMGLLSTDDVTVISGDSGVTPYGGGSWASRGTAMAGEAALKAARQLKANVLELAAAMYSQDSHELTIVAGEICMAKGGDVMGSLAEVAETGHFRQHTLPAEFQPELAVTCSHIPPNDKPPYYVANGVQGSYLEIDTDTGLIKLLEHWAVDDCGRMINPMLVDEQIRGGIVQGIGGALYEKCHYDGQGQMLNATMADYLVPMASEMPDIHVGHVETPTEYTNLGAKGVGEAGTIGALGVIWCAVNDALRPLGVMATHQPFTPESILDLLRARE